MAVPEYVKKVLAKLRQLVNDGAANGGCVCPVCDRHIQVYRRTITDQMAKQLVHSARHCPEIFHSGKAHLPQYPTGNGDFHKLKYWGLIVEVEKDKVPESKKNAGYWSVTKLGMSFVDGDVTIPKHALVKNGDVVGFEGDQTNIIDCFKDSFHYKELMER